MFKIKMKIFKIRTKMKCSELLTSIAMSAANRSKEILEEVEGELKKIALYEAKENK